jgi:hypothetical protein
VRIKAANKLLVDSINYSLISCDKKIARCLTIGCGVVPISSKADVLAGVGGGVKLYCAMSTVMTLEISGKVRGPQKRHIVCM